MSLSNSLFLWIFYLFLAFLQTEIPSALTPLISTMNELTWRSFINKSENLLSAPIMRAKYPSKVTISEFHAEILKEGDEKEEVTIEVENHLIENTQVNLFRFKLGGIIVPGTQYDGYFEAEICYNSNFFTFEGGEIYESEVLDLEQYNEGIETILLRTPKLDQENSALVLLKKKFHNSVIQQELGNSFHLEIKDVQFVPYDHNGDNELCLRVENVEVMLSESKLTREQSPIEIVFETSLLRIKDSSKLKT